MPIVTRETAKTFLGITDTSKDAQIDLLIPAVENDYLLIRGLPFNVDSNDDPIVDYPENSEVVASQMIGYQLANLSPGMQSEKIGSYSYTRDEKIIDGYPKSIVNRIERFQGMR
jgi:hypothetical protein